MLVFRLVLIKPSHYDDEGYVIQFLRSAMPSNTLAALYGLASDCAERRILGNDVEFRFTAIDETNTRVKVSRLARLIEREGGRGLVCLVGVQTNQYPRALDLARQFRATGVQVAIGGFHVSGTLAMLPGVTPELQEALDLGVSLFAGEAEGRLDQVLEDAWAGELQPVYDHMDDLPDIGGTPLPILPLDRVKRTVSGQSSFDAGRGCPFRCSFCTIINVQGRASRHRNADDVEQIVRRNIAQGVKRFFISDDNFARNHNWEEIFDRLGELQREPGVKFNLVLQVDTLCHKIPNFIEKAKLAGVRRVFIGLENINPESLVGAKKPQNRITEYRRMLQAWRRIGVITVAGYILGFPGDTPESIVRDIEIIKSELPIDILEFFYLTPLPGSEDHKVLLERGVWMDPDLNKYDLNHVVTTHDRMSKEEWERALRLAWDTFYTDEHIITLMKRAAVDGMSFGKVLATAVSFFGSVLYEGVHPLESGYIRMKFRRDRRPGLPRESPFVFYPKYLRHVLRSAFGAGGMYLKFYRLNKRLWKVKRGLDYTDRAITTVTDEELRELELYSFTESAVAASEKAQKLVQLGGSRPAASEL
jgi:hypothetical protein